MTAATSMPLVNLMTFQQTAFWLKFRVCYFLWRRQSGKSYTIASKAIDKMLSKAGLSCFFVSASLGTGEEVIEKGAAIWYDALTRLKAAEESLGKKLGGNVIDKRSKEILSVDDLSELMDRQKAQIRIYHSRTQYSRTKTIAPNPKTARGWTGPVFGDEIGFWPDYKKVWDAIEPIISREPDFSFWGFTTPPEDDRHYTYDLLNPGELEFIPNARGNFYKTEKGYPVHRADVHDTSLAGLKLYSPLTGEAVDWDTFREHSQDRTSADRNYALKFVKGGSSAISLAWLQEAMKKGDGQCFAHDLTGRRIA